MMSFSCDSRKDKCHQEDIVPQDHYRRDLRGYSSVMRLRLLNIMESSRNTTSWYD